MCKGIHSFLINNNVLQLSASLNNVGLLNGKMGISLYLFHLAKSTNNPIYREYAEVLIDDIFQVVEEGRVSADFENGLAGIAWGITHLAQNKFVEADTDEVLRDLDDKVLRFLIQQKNIPVSLQSGLLGYGFYLVSRLKGKDISNLSDDSLLLKKALIPLVNDLYDLVEVKEGSFRESYGFRVDWVLPLLITLLAEIYELGIYRHKIQIICDRLSLVVISLFPKLQSNRLYLASAMRKVLEYMDVTGWSQHVGVLEGNIDIEKLSGEFSDKNVAVAQGVSGIILVNEVFNNYRKEEFTSLLKTQIQQSILFDDLSKGIHNINNLGVFHGISGLGMALIA